MHHAVPYAAIIPVTMGHAVQGISKSGVKLRPDSESATWFIADEGGDHALPHSHRNRFLSRKIAPPALSPARIVPAVCKRMPCKGQY